MVVLAAVVVVGVLLWKPWVVGPVPSPSPGGFVAQPPSPSASQPSAAPTLTAPPPTALPTIAPPSPTSADEPPNIAIDIGFIADPGFAFVQCTYRPGEDGASVLARVTVGQPTVILGPEAQSGDLRRVAWHAELQLNELETMFNAEWQPVAKSRRQFSTVHAGLLLFEPIRMRYRQAPPGPTAVIRAVVVVEWFGPGGALLGSRSVVPTSYGQSSALGYVLPEGCHVVQ